MYFDHVHGTASLADDSGLQWTNIPLSVESRAQNSQCSVAFAGNQDSGDSASVTFSVQFTEPQTTLLSIWGRAGDLVGDDSGYQKVGQFQFVQAAAPDFQVSVTPASQSVTAGNTAMYNFTIESLNGLSGPVTSSFSYSGSSALDVATNQTGPVVATAAGVVSGSFEVTTGTDTPPGTVNVIDAFSVGDVVHSFAVSLGVNGTATPDISVSPSSGSGGTQTFTVTAVDSNGFAAIQGFHLLIGSSLDTRNSCWIYFERTPNWLDGRGTASLASDDTTTWTTVSPAVPGAYAQNSQCAVQGGQIITSAGGNAITVALPVSFTAAFSGAKTIYLEVADNNGTTTGYQPRGQWTAAGGTAGQPDFEITLDPAGSDTIEAPGGAFHFVFVTGTNGFTGTVDFTLAGTIPGATITPPHSITIGAAEAGDIDISTSSSTPPGVYWLTLTGTSGNLTHSVTLRETVADPALPGLSMSPASGSGSLETFAFNATDQTGIPGNIAGMTILFGSAVDGRNACWIYQDGNQVWLASDDGLVWSHTDATTTSLENSQCRVTPTPLTQPEYALSLIAQITFKSGFIGTKNVYMDASTNQGRDTGYQQVGTWTLP